MDDEQLLHQDVFAAASEVIRGGFKSITRSVCGFKAWPPPPSALIDQQANWWFLRGAHIALQMKPSCGIDFFLTHFSLECVGKE
ncbi:hypothetical protein CesoFtcFv8_020371 [Champsocephalus esox]|uniref:Uncharacterized protein n=1 Tax=Champsocephalus esox TaxID=159716 RepID=A0AAN8GN27_9TELE|nr:hypothetical protein CesoFtcFv8_020371 [Champsocephalus esox]